MKHIIIGGDGFTGRHLARHLLEQGEHVLVCDVRKSTLDIYTRADFQFLDISEGSSFDQFRLNRDDVIYQLAARQYHEKVPRTGRDAYFTRVNVSGMKNVLEWMAREECGRMIFFSTDMVYGQPLQLPVPEDHARNPFGPYGASKKTAEDLCADFQRKDIKITIFRPRLIVGPGRLGILQKLFKLIQYSLPVPLIGDGTNRYQMVSVYDCVTAIMCAVEHGVPNEVYNLGSEEPPMVRDLLDSLIRACHSRSILVATPGKVVKTVLRVVDAVGLTLMYPEQFVIADENYIVDIGKAKRQLGWAPLYRDEDMMQQAFRECMASSEH